jgi:glycosyltransferase involved in cell wall biosynthesis
MSGEPVKNTMRPLLSIIIPVLRPNEQLARCVYSILAVTMNQKNIEIVIVTSQPFVCPINSMFPFVLTVAENRRGIYAAMNDGIAASSGDYLFFMGIDDIILSTLLKALSVLEFKRPFALFCDVYWGTKGTFSGRPSRLKILTRNCCHQGIIYSRAAIVCHGPYVRSMRVQADHLLNIKILWDRINSSRIIYLKQPLAWYSGDGFSMTNRDTVFWRLYPVIMRKYVGLWAKHLVITYRVLRGAHK